MELRYTSVMRQSITLTPGAYREKRLTAARKRFDRACESLERVRKPSARVRERISFHNQVRMNINWCYH